MAERRTPLTYKGYPPPKPLSIKGNLRPNEFLWTITPLLAFHLLGTCTQPFAMLLPVLPVASHA